MDKTKMKKTESFASIFGDDFDETPVVPEDGTTSIQIEQLVPFENHPFKLYEGERFDEMVESIKNFGVIVPIVARKKGRKFEILSGHNRVNAAKEAGLKEVPSVVKEGLSEDEAMLIVTETNLMQRSFTDLAHSERAKVIATRHDALKKQGVRNDLLSEIERLSKAPNLATQTTCAPMGHKLKTRDVVGAEFNLSRNSVARYLRINQLNHELKGQVDEGKIAMRAGVDLSYLSDENQEMIDAIVSEDTFKVDMKKASMIRAFEGEGKLNWKVAKDIITGEAMKDPNKQKPIKIQSKIISKFFSTNQKQKDIESIIEKALEMYFHKKQEPLNLNEEEGDEMLG